MTEQQRMTGMVREFGSRAQLREAQRNPEELRRVYRKVVNNY